MISTREQNSERADQTASSAEQTLPDLDPPSGLAETTSHAALPGNDATGRSRVSHGPASGQSTAKAPSLVAAMPAMAASVSLSRSPGHGAIEPMNARSAFGPAIGSDGESESVVVRRGRRIDEKISAARRLLATFDSNDRRARLVHAAIVRRDETLLDALLANSPPA